jgi:transcription elongation factor Elf1
MIIKGIYKNTGVGVVFTCPICGKEQNQVVCSGDKTVTYIYECKNCEEYLFVRLEDGIRTPSS